MHVLRTPDAQFVDLPDFPFAPHYLEVGAPALRVAYIDEGPRDAAPILLLYPPPTAAIAFTSTPCSAHSTASTLVICETAALEAA